MKHERIIGYVEYFEDANHGYLVSELFDFYDQPLSPLEADRIPFTQDLYELIEERGALTETQARNILLQLLSALDYLHQSGWVHGDIKDENILVNDSHEIKLIDFGAVKRIDASCATRFTGTVQYAPPEVFYQKQCFPLAMEMWTVGCLLYIMLHGRLPFTHSDQVKAGKHQPIHSGLSRTVVDLISKMLCADPCQRITFDALYDHPWLAL